MLEIYISHNFVSALVWTVFGLVFLFIGIYQTSKLGDGDNDYKLIKLLIYGTVFFLSMFILGISIPDLICPEKAAYEMLMEEKGND